MPAEEQNAPAPPPAETAPPETVECPECGARFAGKHIAEASARLAQLEETVAAVRAENETLKLRLETPAPSEPPAEPAPAPETRKRRLLHGVSRRVA